MSQRREFNFDVDLLMAAQYNMPLTEEPFVALSEKLGVSFDYLKNELESYLRKGLIIRIGPQLNYKAFRGESVAALVGVKVEGNRIFEVARMINNESGVKHNFLREDENYNLWYTIKAKDKEALIEKIKTLMERCEVEDYIVLPSRRVYKMDVKYDLYKGVSWSNRIERNEKVPLVEELGISPKLLKDMEKNFSVEERPFRKFAEKYGMKEGEIVDLLKELIEKRVVRDFYAVLNGERAGFKENGMNLVRTENPEKVAKILLELFPQITHLVERECPENWNYPLYFMVHAFERETIEKIAQEVREIEGVEEVRILYSKMNLRNI